jgi:hypothetical protein
MWTYLLAQTLTSGERIEAVHGHFSSRTGADGLQVLYATLIVAVLLCVVLVLLNRVQQAKEQREERARDQARRARTAAFQQPGQQSLSTASLIEKRQAATPAPTAARR